MTKQGTRLSCVFAVFIAVIAALFLSPHPSSAGILMDAGFKGVYEDNITGSSADLGKEGDYYTAASASIGGYRNIGRGVFAFMRINAEGYLYGRYSELDAAIAGVSGGFYKVFSPVVSASAIVLIKREQYKGEGRSSTAYGGILNLRQQVHPRIWIKESYEFERNAAASDIFSYEGHLPGITASYTIAPKTTALLGYSYLYRSYNEPAGFRDIFNTLSLGMTREILKKVYLNGSYDRQYISTNLPGTSHVNNVFSLGVSYSY